MKLYCTPYIPITDRSAFEALLPPARLARLAKGETGTGSLFAYALLAYALDQDVSFDTRSIIYTETGKPYLPGHPVHFSLSHSKTHALCAVAGFAIGCDIETHRPVSERLKQRILGTEKASADFFTHWTLKESNYKLCGRFALPAVHWEVYHDIPDCTAAIVASESFVRPELALVPPETLLR
ncbi:MAG: hypothetical protein FWD84_01155 [Oscillospiraceae bacterium]|nr:hypothetical protein [Oscillospiraceae bacterium]